jgi:hypothetical protein
VADRVVFASLDPAVDYLLDFDPDSGHWVAMPIHVDRRGLRIEPRTDVLAVISKDA